MTTPDPYQEHKDRVHLRDERRAAVARIFGDMRYQTRPGVHTVGACANECGKFAHGAHVCHECLREELAAEVGRELADAYAAAFYEARRVEALIWEEVER